MKPMLFYSLLFFLFSECGEMSPDPSQRVAVQAPGTLSILNPAGKTIESRFNVPDGFERIKELDTSFATYLRKLPLKPAGSRVKYFNGKEKSAEGIYEAVLDLPIGKKDLHQCADAVMRLRADYLYSRGLFDKIHFNFTNGFKCSYSEWMKGKRVTVKGNNASWKQAAQPSNTPKDFWNYLEMVFSYAGSLSLSKELKSVPAADMQIGDVFIQGGSPGHAVMVVDMAMNPKTSEKLFMLAQSYMPAQETHVLVNPANDKNSPWYSLDFGESLATPEWTFTKNDLRRFE